MPVDLQLPQHLVHQVAGEWVGAIQIHKPLSRLSPAEVLPHSIFHKFFVVAPQELQRRYCRIDNGQHAPAYLCSLVVKLGTLVELGEELLHADSPMPFVKAATLAQIVVTDEGLLGAPLVDTDGRDSAPSAATAGAGEPVYAHNSCHFKTIFRR